MLPMSNLRNKAALAAVSTALLLLVGTAPALAGTKAPKAVAPADASAAAERAEDAYTPPLPNEVLVSDRDFNQFVFPSAIVNGPIFPAGSPLVGKPVYLAGNTQVLIQVAAGSEKPFNMIVELDSGAVYKFYLKPRPINGVTHRVDGATERGKTRQVASEEAQPSAPRGSDVELLKQAVMGNIPSGFEATDLPPLTRFDKFSVIPLAGWSDGASRRIMSFNLVAVPGQSAVVAPPQFYRNGITAVTLDGDSVDATHTPTLYVVEEITPDEQ
jgi:TraK protein